MNCIWGNAQTPDDEGKRQVRCKVCDYRTKTRTAYPFHLIYRECPRKKGVIGVGGYVMRLLHDAGAKPSSQCKCRERANQMDQWQAEGCREHRAEIVAWLREAAFKQWVTQQIAVGWAISREPWFRLSDPLGSLVDEAIRLSESAAVL